MATSPFTPTDPNPENPYTGSDGASNSDDSHGWPYGGSGSSGPTAEQKKAVENLGGIVGYNRDTILGTDKNANDLFDISDKQNENLRNAQTLTMKQKAGGDWYTQQQKLQSVTQNMMDTGGNAFNGSGLYDLMDLVARADDMADVEVLNKMRENQGTIDASYYEALFQSNNARNESAMNTERDLRELAADYVSQANNIHPDLAEDMIDGKKHTLNIPDWLDTSYYQQHRRDAINVDNQGLYRPDNAADGASRADNQSEANTASSANQSYRDKLFAGYSRRNQ